MEKCTNRIMRYRLARAIPIGALNLYKGLVKASEYRLLFSGNTHRDEYERALKG